MVTEFLSAALETALLGCEELCGVVEGDNSCG